MIEELVPLLESIDTELILPVIGLIVGLIEGGRKWRDTGKIPLRDLPWAAKREIFRWFRQSYFTVDKPTNEPSFVMEGMSVSQARESLMRQGFVPEWMLSYPYGGEDANMRRYFYDPALSLPHRQIHVRMFENPEGVEVMCHSEPAPDLHPEEHLEHEHREFSKANDFVRARLEDEKPVGYPTE